MSPFELVVVVLVVVVVVVSVFPAEVVGQVEPVSPLELVHVSPVGPLAVVVVVLPPCPRGLLVVGVAVVVVPVLVVPVVVPSPYPLELVEQPVPAVSPLEPGQVPPVSSLELVVVVVFVGALEPGVAGAPV
jgi:hypothetical protein